MTPPYENFVILTGGPGAGKSTLIDALSRRGYATYPEAGRAIIQEQVRIGGRALPWEDSDLYAETGLSWDIRSYREAERNPAELVFFDRGVPDSAAGMRRPDGSMPSYAEAAMRIYPYRRQAFLAPPWAEIFTQDAERKQTFDEALVICSLIEKEYSEYGYELIPLPLVSVAERVEFVLAHALR